MQTERVTFLTTPDHKAALDAFAKEHGKSVGHVLREASAIYVSQPRPRGDEEAEHGLELVAAELEALIPRWNAHFDSIEASLDQAHLAVRQALAEVEATK